MYNPKSMKADEFISDEEIRETLSYAEKNKDNIELIDSIIEKAKLRKGLNHGEASVLLACENQEKLDEVYALAEQIKKDFYGNRIVIFAPLYLSNYCVNGCVYCPYHAKNKHIQHDYNVYANISVSFASKKFQRQITLYLYYISRIFICQYRFFANPQILFS